MEQGRPTSFPVPHSFFHRKNSALLAALAISLLALVGARPAVQPPQGCEAVFAGTTLGGARMPPSINASCTVRRPPKEAFVERVVDGDTIVLASGERVRYIGIDTPEVSDSVEYFGPEAAKANRSLVEGKEVRLEKDISDKDRYGRSLRYVYADGLFINAELVRRGLARAVDYPPDTRYSACFLALEEEARAEGRGMWGANP